MTKKETKEKRIDDILGAAVNVFVEKGYENATMSDIASRAGISKGGLYHHFLSKDMVLLYANQKLMEPCAGMMLEAKRNPSITEGLKSYILNYLEYWADRKKELIFFSLSMTKAMTHRDIFKLYEKYVEEYISSFEEFFKKGVDNGEFVPHNTKGSAVALMSALDGVLIYMALDKKLGVLEVAKSFEERFIDTVICSKHE